MSISSVVVAVAVLVISPTDIIKNIAVIVAIIPIILLYRNWGADWSM